jgi:predicted nucleic acid-binding Zn ribbon protein
MSTIPTQPLTLTRVLPSRQCQQCGIDFWPLVNNPHQQVCSRRCRDKLNALQKRQAVREAKTVEHYCPHCKQRFSTSKAGKKYCGARCAADHRRQLERDERAASQEKRMTTCAHCQQSFQYVVSNRPPRRYCSRECAGSSAMEASRLRSAAARERVVREPEPRVSPAPPPWAKGKVKPVVLRTKSLSYPQLSPVDDAGLEALLDKERDSLKRAGLPLMRTDTIGAMEKARRVAEHEEATV